MKKIITKKRVIIASVIIVLLGCFLFYRWKIYHSEGSFKGNKIFEIKPGTGVKDVASQLKKENIVSCRTCFVYYVWAKNLKSQILPGNYELSGRLTIPEISSIITSEKDNKIIVTFPEGWNSKQMAARLNEKGLDGDGFLQLANKPGDLLDSYDFFEGKKVKTLEGYLFPDTYYFTKDDTAREIITKLLNNFKLKFTEQMNEDVKKQGKKVEEIVTMASIVEKEVRLENEKKIVAGLFWNRIKNQHALQSCATLAYILGQNKKQYSFSDTRTVSPYNTYINKGLPPSPISNPGLSSIDAAIYPKDTNYNYFLSDPETGKTYFSETITQHNSYKQQFGL